LTDLAFEGNGNSSRPLTSPQQQGAVHSHLFSGHTVIRDTIKSLWMTQLGVYFK